MMSSRTGSGIMGPGRPEQPDRVGLAGGFQAGQQVAEPLGAGDPGGVHERGQAEQFRAASASQVARSREVSSRGSPVPPASDRVSGVVMFRRPGSVPPQTGAFPANAAAASSRPW